MCTIRNQIKTIVNRVPKRMRLTKERPYSWVGYLRDPIGLIQDNLTLQQMVQYDKKGECSDLISQYAYYLNQ